jgi:hypothetical protein
MPASPERMRLLEGLCTFLRLFHQEPDPTLRKQAAPAMKERERFCAQHRGGRFRDGDAIPGAEGGRDACIPAYLTRDSHLGPEHVFSAF